VSDSPSVPSHAGPVWSPWRTIVAFGIVSLAADMVYEGMRSLAGPLLGELGASALTVGVITGAGEAVALVLRLLTGTWADRSQRHWALTVVGYGMTAVCVPLLAVTPFLGTAGLAVAATLILLERTGKAVRSPAESALLARMASGTCRGKGFGVHKALDQVGAFAGPLLLAASAAATGMVWPGFAVLAVPGVLSMLLLAQLRRRAPIVVQPDVEEVDEVLVARSTRSVGVGVLGLDLPVAFHVFSAAVALTTARLTTFGVISYRFVQDDMVDVAAVPLVYALAMATGAVAALVSGSFFDRVGARVLLVVPPLVALVPPLVFADQLTVVVLGIVCWGAAFGVQDSAVKAQVADLVPASRRASGYGVFAAVQGIGALVGGVVAGALVDDHVVGFAIGVAVVQVVAFAMLARSTGQRS
jgi:MFS family permease